jgi:hypothetical protein
MKMLYKKNREEMERQKQQQEFQFNDEEQLIKKKLKKQNIINVL